MNNPVVRYIKRILKQLAPKARQKSWTSGQEKWQAPAGGLEARIAGCLHWVNTEAMWVRVGYT